MWRMAGFLLLELSEAYTCDGLLHFILTDG